MVTSAQRALFGDAVALLLALEVAAGGAVGNGGLLAGDVLGGRAVLLGGVGDAEQADREDHHRRVEGPALAAVADHAAELRRRGGGDQQDEDHLDEVRELGRVLEREGAVDVEEAAAVGAELLDRDLRCGRPPGEGLIESAQAGEADIGREVLDHALGDQDQGPDRRERQQDVEERAGDVPPEVAELLDAAAREAPDHGGQYGHADRRRDEVLDGQAGHLREVASSSSRRRSTASSCW